VSAARASNPYLDGNGRIGRLLITLLLEEWKLLEQPLLYLSLFFKQHRAEYYRLLNAVRLEGAWEAWVAFFLEGVSTIADEAAATVRDLFVMVTIPTIVRLLKTTKPTPAKAVSVLERLGILKETTGRRRDRAYGYSGYLERLRAGTDLTEP
jgi:Fic family protein